MSRSAVEMLLYLLDVGFEGNPEHSLLGNLVDLGDGDWEWRPEGGGRCIRDIVLHAGAAKYVSADYAFGAATISFSRAMRVADARVSTLGEAGSWLAQGHRLLRARVASLDDSDLGKPRRVHYGPPEETRHIISSMIQHDLYHAGEINHLRAFRQGTDFWPGQGPTTRGGPR
jgi:hypothetical protein